MSRMFCFDTVQNIFKECCNTMRDIQMVKMTHIKIIQSIKYLERNDVVTFFVNFLCKNLDCRIVPKIKLCEKNNIAYLECHVIFNNKNKNIISFYPCDTCECVVVI